MSMLKELIDKELADKKLEPDKIRPLALAYLGDTILDLYVRSRIVEGTTLHPKEMHQLASSMVNASSQAKMMKHILDLLDEEEREVFRHARNQQSGTMPKNQSPIDYKWATGMEALLGYLYLKGREERLYQLMKEATDYLQEEKKHE